MKKKIIPIITILILIICGIFVVVKNKDNTNDYNKPPTTDNQKSDDKKSKNNNDNNKNNESNENTTNEDKEDKEDSGVENLKDSELPDWTNFDIKINNSKLKLPILYSDFEKETGFKIPDIREGDLYAGLQSLQDIPVVNDNNERFYINIENRSEDEKTVYECYVTGIRTKEYNSIIFQEDLTLGINYDKVVEKLGEPLEIWQPDVETTAVWNINNTYECNITFNENNEAIEIVMNTKSL